MTVACAYEKSNDVKNWLFTPPDWNSVGVDNEKPRASRKRIQFSLRRLVSITLGVAIIMYPFNTRVAPAFKIHVTDAKGRAITDCSVREWWEHSSFEKLQHDSFEEVERDQKSSPDENGYVYFPERNVRANVITRIIGPIRNIIQGGAHASFGPSANIVAFGSKYETSDYIYIEGDPKEKVVDGVFEIEFIMVHK